MKHSTYTSYDELPLMLSVAEVAAVLGISRAGAYELVRGKRNSNGITQPSGAATPRDSDAHERVAVPQALCVLREHPSTKAQKRQSMPF